MFFWYIITQYTSHIKILNQTNCFTGKHDYQGCLTQIDLFWCKCKLRRNSFALNKQELKILTQVYIFLLNALQSC